MKWVEGSHGFSVELHKLVRVVVYQDRENVWRWSLLDLTTRGWIVEDQPFRGPYVATPAGIKKEALRSAALLIDKHAQKWAKLSDSLLARKDG